MAEIVDAHLHAVSADVTRYPQHPSGYGRDWWSGRDLDGDRIAADLHAAGVGRGVIVQAVGPYRTDNRYARAVVAAHPDRFALVAAIDAEADDPGAEIARELAAGPVAGVRVIAASGRAPWLADARGHAVFAAMSAARVPLVAALQAPHLGGLGALAGEHPDVVVALDHAAFPDFAGGPPYPAAAPLFALAALPGVHVKVSTINLLAAAVGGGDDRFVAHLVEEFGPDRVCWGSDHPQSFETNYPDMVRIARDACRALDAGDRDQVLGGTAARLWFGG